MKLWALVVLVPNLAWAANISCVNGVCFTCSGSLSVINGTALCNGQPVNPPDNSQPASVCGAGTTTKKWSNGGGTVDATAIINPKAIIKGTVCGKSSIGKDVLIKAGAMINGGYLIAEGATIEEGVTLNGMGGIGQKVKIGKNSTLNGTLAITNSDIAPNTTLNGNIVINGVSVSGQMTCTGDGEIRAAPPVESAQ